ncbi:MAG: MobA/MobL family protein [Chloroflexota bacterium]
MRLGHFHFHGAVVKRSHYSTARSSAVASAAYQANESLTHEQQRIGEMELVHRKSLNKGIVNDALREEFRQYDIALSDDATAERINRRNWVVKDGDSLFRIKEFEERETDKETGKRKVVKRALDLSADITYDYTDKHDLMVSWVQVSNRGSAEMQQIAAKRDAISREDRQLIWNQVEQMDVSRLAWPARKISMALPRDLSQDENLDMLRQYVDEQFTRHDFLVDVAVHSVTASDGKANLHAHLLIPIRPVSSDGFAAHKHDYADKSHYWNNKKRYIEQRKAWADLQNAKFKELGLDVRVSHRSYKADGIDKTPTQHLGPAADHMEKRGERTRKGDRNREIDWENAQKAGWDYGLDGEPHKMSAEPTEFMPRPRKSRMAGEKLPPIGGRAGRYPFDTPGPAGNQMQRYPGQHSNMLHLDPKLLKNLENAKQVASIGMQNGRLKSALHQPQRVKEAIVTAHKLKQPLTHHQQRGEQRSAVWISRALGTALNFTKQAMQQTNQAVRQAIGRWTGREQRRVHQQDKQKENDFER